MERKYVARFTLNGEEASIEFSFKFTSELSEVDSTVLEEMVNDSARNIVHMLYGKLIDVKAV